MAPVALTPQAEMPTLSLLKEQMLGGENGSAVADIKEDWAGDYRFAPIEEAQVSRAMIKRYAPMYALRSSAERAAGTSRRCTTARCPTS
jgi:hypothetical protein